MLLSHRNSRVHFVEYDNQTLLYLPDLLKFYNINNRTKKIIIDIKNGGSKEDILNKHNIDEAELSNILDILSQDTLEAKGFSISNSFLYKLVINITNKCNLNCIYCYANGGNYDSEESIMSENVLKKTLDIFFEKYKEIGVIQLFGGEPTLNLDAIEFTCKYIEKKFENKEIINKPVIGLTTNGMCASERFIELIKKYDIKLTVSIDGPSVITNRTRVTNKGKGVAELLEKNIEILQNTTGEPSSAEVTFTQYHIDENISVEDAINFVKDRFNISYVHISPVSAEPDLPYKLKNRESFMDAIPDIINRKTNGYMIVNKVINKIQTKKIDSQICGAGNSVLSVSVNGDIYPCFMFTDISDYKIGNIFSDKIELWKKLDEFNFRYHSYNRYKSEQCSNCFNNTICSGCMGMNYFNTGDAFKNSEEECQFLKDLTENVLISISKRNAYS